MTTHTNLVAAASRFDPVPLLGLLAGMSARQLGERIPGVVAPWAIPAIARECLASDTSDVMVPTEADVADMGRIHINLHDPYVNEWQDDDGMDGLTVRYVYEQMPFKHPVEREHQRAIALYDRDYGALPRPCQVLSQAAWEQGLGRPIGTVLRSAMIIREVAATNGGSFDPSWLRRRAHAGRLEDAAVTADDVEFVFNAFFVADYADHRRRAAEKRHEDERLRRLDFNPLVEHPFVRLPDGRCIAPSLHLVAMRLGPASLYFIGNQLWPRPDGAATGATPFSGDAGEVLEAYVGELLGRTNPTLLVPERTYTTKEGEKKTADYVIAEPDSTFVLEVKSARVNLLSRLGFAAYLKDAYADIGKAIKQIDETARMIFTRNQLFPERFSKNLKGIVVSADPHYMINSRQYRELNLTDPMTRTKTELRLPKGDYPTTVVSLEELEQIVELIGKTGTFDLLKEITTPGKDGLEVAAIIAACRSRYGG